MIGLKDVVDDYLNKNKNLTKKGRRSESVVKKITAEFEKLADVYGVFNVRRAADKCTKPMHCVNNLAYLKAILKNQASGGMVKNDDPAEDFRLAESKFG